MQQGMLIPVPEAGEYGKKLLSLRRESLDGVRVLPGWGRLRNSPAYPHLLCGDPEHPYDVADRPWLDHLYRLKLLSEDRIVYRSEPYWLHRDGWKDLEEIEDNGWDVSIGGYAYHYVTTVVISIEKK